MCFIGLGAAPVKKAKKKKVLPKHYIDMHAGAGVSGFGYSLTGGHNAPAATFSLGAGYTWFFRSSIGLQTGFAFTRLANNAHLTEPMQWTQLTDYQGEEYTHITSFDHWRERQQAYLIEIPIGLRFRYRKRQDDRAGLHAAAGISLAFPFISGYKHTSGTITHSAWYEQWHLELHDLPGRYETEAFIAGQEESLKPLLSPVNLFLKAEIGTIIRINDRSDFVLAAYTSFMPNNFSTVKRDERIPLGFHPTQFAAPVNEQQYAFMPYYQGLLVTDHASALHPWTAGIKLQLSIWPGQTERQKKRILKRLVKQYPELAPIQYIHDTTVLLDTIVLHDTIYIERAPEPSEGVAKIDSLLREAVIWFHFDEYDPILEPEWLLDSVAMMMKRYPDLQIQVNGHACIIGGDAYNRQLALKRAKAVAAILRRKGVPAKRMTVQSFGATHPYRYNAEHQLSKDRRVEIIPEEY